MKKLKFPKGFNDFKFTDEMKESFQTAAKYAKLDGVGEVTVFNFLYTVLRDEEENVITATLESMKVDMNILLETVFDKRGEGEKSKGEEIILSKEITELILNSYQLVTKTKRAYGIDDLFLVILKEKNSATELLLDNSIEYSVFKESYEEVVSFFDLDGELDGEVPINFEPAIAPIEEMNLRGVKGSPSNLIKSFTTNMNEEFANGAFSECIGRQKEIDFLERVLNRSKKKNSILVGKAGVGKTQIIEGLVQKIVEKKVSPTLQGKTILALNTNALEAGTSLRGQLEERIRLLTNYLTSNPNIILFIDEIHTIMGGGRNSSVDLSDVLKPYLTKDKLQIIGATTTEEYKSFIQNNRAFSRRFAVQHIDELSKEDTLEILRQIKGKYEKYHNVSYPDSILYQITEFCANNLKNLSFPDKAIDILDDLGASLVSKQKEGKELKKVNKEIEELRLTKKYVIENKKYEEIESINHKEQSLKEKYEGIISDQRNGLSERQEVNSEMFLNYVKETFKIDNYFGDDFEAFIDNVEQNIKNKLIGQDEVVDGVLRHIKMRKLFDDYESPLAFVFLGESGVGKTYFANLLGENVFNGKMKIINGELFKDAFTVSNLIGSPKGYVDSDKGSSLFEFIKHNPESLIVVDEAEKAHPNFFDTILSLLDNGFLEDKDGFIVDASRCMFILITNNGFENTQIKTIGFGVDGEKEKKMFVERSLSKTFKPEFINRFDEIFQFNHVQTFEDAIDKEFENIRKKLLVRNINISLTEETRKQIVEDCKKEKGAYRAIKRIMKKKVMQNITNDYKQQRLLKI